MVLDSNIQVGILIFDDVVACPIRATLEADRLDAVISPVRRKELRRVLGYPQLARYAVDTQAVLTRVDRVVRSIADPEDAVRAQGEASVPHCKDRGDQKSLVSVDAADIVYLVPRDHAVLKFKRHMAKYCDMVVLSFKQFIALVQLENTLLTAIPNQA